ncbi:hypothetical protein SAMN06265349_103281 [Flavobacterium resistens]|uniref:Uncharacterized protein n=1 Tax=Flavobacterium resistens TaxID=443612 RepID=A0A521DI66_9FLAO|nr:hypothetical protein [Flavobacterium resistens]MRX68738.1 hypothetical protein [Flavobacterium resistens]SMO71328.1 hypothetical protein SAMN06265349_103281 [Flavobacterium resistens]
MEEEIIYKSGRNEKVISKEELHTVKNFFKNFYIDDELIRTEYISSDSNSNFTIYYLNNNQSIEEILLENNQFLDRSFHYKLFDKFGFTVYLFQSYDFRNLEQQSIIIKDKEENLVVKTGNSLKTYEDSSFFNFSKTIKSDAKYSILSRKVEEDSTISVNYFENGDFKSAYFSNENLEMNLQEFLFTNDFSERYHLNIDKDFLKSFFPIIPNSDFNIPEICIEYSDYYKNKIAFKEIFTERFFHKTLYLDKKKRFIEKFAYGKIVSKTYFLNIDETIEDFLEEMQNGIEYCFYHKPIIKNNCTYWEVIQYDENGMVIEKRNEVYNYQDQLISVNYLLSNKFRTHSLIKYCYKNNYESQILSIYMYDDSGAISYIDDCGFGSDSMWEDTVWEMPNLKFETYINRIEDPFFKSFFSEVPESSKEEIEIIYKNHLGQVISENEIKKVYEYKKEVKINQLTKEIKTYKDNSCSFVEYYCSDQEKPEDFEFYSTRNFIVYHNKKHQNGYFVYDIFESVVETLEIGHYKGILVQDFFGREITRVVFKNDEMDLKYARKISYDNFKSELGYDFDTVIVNFEDSNKVLNYYSNETTYTVDEFEKEQFSSLNKTNNSFFKSIFPFVPEIEAKVYEPFIFKLKLKKQENSFEPEEIKCLYNSNNKLKYVFDGYKKWSFLKDRSEVNLKLPELLYYGYNISFYNIKHADEIISCDVVYNLQFEKERYKEFNVKLKISTTSFDFSYESDDPIFSFRKIFFEHYEEELFCFYLNEERIWNTEISKERLIMFLMET